MKTALLVRVSTNRQDTDRQIHELTEVAKQRNWEIVEVIEEHGVSGSSKIRPGIDRALELATSGAIKKVLVHEVSRLARKNSVSHKFIEDLEELGVSLYWHTQGVETLLPNGKRNPGAAMIFSIMAEMARSEKETLVERVKSGIAEARRKGVVFGRPVGTGPTPEQLLQSHADIVRLLRDDHSIRHISKITGKSATTVQKVKKLL